MNVVKRVLYKMWSGR